MMGDITNDGLVNIQDVVELIEALVDGLAQDFTHCEAYVSDYDSNKMLTITDIVLLIDFLVNGG